MGRSLLVVLACLLMAAHFLRTGDLLVVAVCVAFPALLWVRHAAAIHVLRAGLVLACIEWLHTLWVLTVHRQAAGEPWVRMAVILGAVALVTLAAALLARSRVPQGHDVPAQKEG